MSTETFKNGTSTTNESYVRKVLDSHGKDASYAAGNPSILTTRSLYCEQPRTFEDDLRTIITSWHFIYGNPPWHEMAQRYGIHNLATAADVEKKHGEYTSVKVDIFKTIFC